MYKYPSKFSPPHVLSDNRIQKIMFDEGASPYTIIKRIRRFQVKLARILKNYEYIYLYLVS